MVNETKKIGKIIDELVTYFLYRGHEKVTIDIKKEHEATSIKISMLMLPTDDIVEIRHQLEQKRDYAMEEYGWELMGECETTSELMLVGLCMNQVIIEEKDGQLVIELIRNDA